MHLTDATTLTIGFEKKFLRIENGVLTETTANIPESDILIGYLQLTEIQ